MHVAQVHSTQKDPSGFNSESMSFYFAHNDDILTVLFLVWFSRYASLDPLVQIYILLLWHNKKSDPDSNSNFIIQRECDLLEPQFTISELIVKKIITIMEY